MNARIGISLERFKRRCDVSELDMLNSDEYAHVVHLAETNQGIFENQPILAALVTRVMYMYKYSKLLNISYFGGVRIWLLVLLLSVERTARF